VHVRRHFAAAAALVSSLGALAVPARAQGPVRAVDPPATADSRNLAIETRLTGRQLDAIVDGYGAPPGAAVPGGTTLDAFPAGLALGTSPWSPVPPPALWVHSTIYDPIRDRLVVFGGQGYGGSTNEVWAFYLSGIPHWSRLQPSGTLPSARGFHSAVYDTTADRMIVFGGSDGSAKNDVWELSFAGNPTWTKLTPSGTPPPPREWHVAVLDRARNRMLVHGGVNGGTRLGDVWALSLGASPAWTQITAGGASPGGRSSHCALLDVANDRMIVFAGLDGTGAATNSIWSLSLGATPTWSALAATGTPPTARYGASARYDKLRHRALFFGGGIGAPNTSETWALSLTGTPAWTLLPAPNPPQGRQFHTSAYDPFGDRLLVFGGSSGPVLSDTWALPLASPGASWIPLTGTRRRGHSAVYDPSRHRMVVFGGESGTQLNDVWELGLSSTGTWARLNPTGTPPAPRALHAAIYDERRDRMLVFGGRGGPARNDLWELTFSGTLEWRPITALGTPPPARFDHVMVYDAARYRLLVFGGIDANGTFNDTWSLSLSGNPTWTQLASSGTRPSGRAGSQAVYDALRNRLVVIGGYSQTFVASNDVWQLALEPTTPAWSQMSPSGTKPAPRFAAATVYDPNRDRAVFTSGTDFSLFFTDTWELRFGTGTQASWSMLPDGDSGPTSRSDHKAVWDPNADRMVVFGGINLGGVLHDTWSMEFMATVDVPGGPAPGIGSGVSLALAGANPARGTARFAWTLPSAGPVALAIHDATGRRVRTLENGPRGAGTHAATWDGRDDQGHQARPGVYFARLVAAAGSATTKVILLD
jgi:hypothetical protein